MVISSAVLVSSSEYNDDGEPFKTIDPAGKEDRTEYDDAGAWNEIRRLGLRIYRSRNTVCCISGLPARMLRTRAWRL